MGQHFEWIREIEFDLHARYLNDLDWREGKEKVGFIEFNRQKSSE